MSTMHAMWAGAVISWLPSFLALALMLWPEIRLSRQELRRIRDEEVED